MIRLIKQALPVDLARKMADRTARYLALLAAGEPIPESLAGAYKDPAVKQRLREETFDKCAYCESKVTHVDYGDVEHIISKKVQPELRFEFSNLTFACGVCNTKKGDYHDDQTPLVNPYTDEPSEHLVAVGPMVMRHPASDRGLITEKLLKLNRGDLVERRGERLQAIGILLDQIARTGSSAIRKVLLDQASLECGADKEYSFVVRAYVASVEKLLPSN